MKNLVIYVHGKGGSAAEADHYKPLFPEAEVIGFDYHSQSPWEACEEFPAYFNMQRSRCDCLTLIANSIGAYFAMSALNQKHVDSALLISPVVNMTRLIEAMMKWANITEQQLCAQKEIPTEFGETLSWDYLCYARSHPISWNIPTAILYGEADNLTSYETISAFAEQTGSQLTVMKGGEHWFHTEAQLQFLDCWIKQQRK